MFSFIDNINNIKNNYLIKNNNINNIKNNYYTYNLLHIIMLIIGLVGKERVGKDTFSDYVIDKYGFKKYNLAKPIKDIANIMFGWDNDKLEGSSKDKVDEKLGIKPRDFFTWFGTEVGQFSLHHKFPNLKIPPRSIWSLAMDNWIQQQYNENNDCYIIIPDVRFCHEMDVLTKYNPIIINITKSYPFTDQTISNLSYQQVSNNNYQLDDLLQNYEIHYTINNNKTLEKYKQNISKLMKILHLGLNKLLFTDEALKSNYTMYI